MKSSVQWVFRHLKLAISLAFFLCLIVGCLLMTTLGWYYSQLDLAQERQSRLIAEKKYASRKSEVDRFLDAIEEDLALNRLAPATLPLNHSMQYRHLTELIGSCYQEFLAEYNGDDRQKFPMADAYFRLGKISYLNDDYQQAVKSYTQSLELIRNSSLTLASNLQEEILATRVLQQLAETEMALSNFDQALIRSNGAFEAHQRIARPELDHELREPLKAKLHAQRGLIHRKLGQLDVAINSLTQATILFREHVIAEQQSGVRYPPELLNLVKAQWDLASTLHQAGSNSEVERLAASLAKDFVEVSQFLPDVWPAFKDQPVETVQHNIEQILENTQAASPLGINKLLENLAQEAGQPPGPNTVE